VDTAGQGLLFAERNPAKVVPFESFAASRIEPLPPKPAPKPPARKRPTESQRSNEQGMLDFLPPIPPGPRTLKTKVEAVIYCDAPVASSTHRCLAALLDWSMIAVASGLFLLIFQLCGGDLMLNRVTVVTFTAAFIVLGLFYGFLWLLANTETPGMRWVHLQLTNFDGLPPDRIHRALRFAGTCLSFSAARIVISVGKPSWLPRSVICRVTASITCRGRCPNSSGPYAMFRSMYSLPSTS
jgi:hypothetical protein